MLDQIIPRLARRRGKGFTEHPQLLKLRSLLPVCANTLTHQEELIRFLLLFNTSGSGEEELVFWMVKTPTVEVKGNSMTPSNFLLNSVLPP